MTGQPGPRFVLHEHFARHHHFDLRLEHNGVLASWAVPKGLPEKTGERRLAVAVEDHAIDYLDFEGTIPEGGYGAGDVRIFDSGSYVPLSWEKDRIVVVLKGSIFSGKFTLLRFLKEGEDAWLVIRNRA